jgi:hypothetical protein
LEKDADVNEKDQVFVEWFLGIFGTAGLFIALALIGMGAQNTRMGWLSYVLGSLAFAIGPFLVVACRPRALTGGVVGLGMAVGALALLVIFASIYGVEIPLLVVIAALLLGFIGGALGEPWLETA